MGGGGGGDGAPPPHPDFVTRAYQAIVQYITSFFAKRDEPLSQ